MSNKFKDIGTKNRTHYFCDDMINERNLDAKKARIDENWCKNFFIYFIEYVTVKNLTYAKANSVNPLYIIIDKTNRYIEESNQNKYSTLVPTYESKDPLNNYEELFR